MGRPPHLPRVAHQPVLGAPVAFIAETRAMLSFSISLAH